MSTRGGIMFQGQDVTQVEPAIVAALGSGCRGKKLLRQFGGLPAATSGEPFPLICVLAFRRGAA